MRHSLICVWIFIWQIFTCILYSNSNLELDFLLRGRHLFLQETSPLSRSHLSPDFLFFPLHSYLQLLDLVDLIDSLVLDLSSFNQGAILDINLEVLFLLVVVQPSSLSESVIEVLVRGHSFASFTVVYGDSGVTIMQNNARQEWGMSIAHLVFQVLWVNFVNFIDEL